MDIVKQEGMAGLDLADFAGLFDRSAIEFSEPQ